MKKRIKEPLRSHLLFSLQFILSDIKETQEDLEDLIGIILNEDKKELRD